MIGQKVCNPVIVDVKNCQSCAFKKRCSENGVLRMLNDSASPVNCDPFTINYDSCSDCRYKTFCHDALDTVLKYDPVGDKWI